MRSRLPDLDLSGVPVFLRADLNVPLIDGTIISDYRLEALRPTLDLLIQKKAQIILATHLGRPQNNEKDKEALTTKHLLTWFKEKGYAVTWAPLFKASKELQNVAPGTILLLENLRFDEREIAGSSSYTQELKDLADYYVQDAWGALHKKDTSITLLPELFDKDHKTIGLLVERELEELDALRSPERPFVMIMGGAKVKQKLPALEEAVDKRLADTIIVLPALAFTFLEAQGNPVGDSLVEESLLVTAQRILEKAAQKGVQIVLPKDFMVGNDDLSGTLETASSIPHGKIGIALGPKSLEEAYRIVQSSKTVFFNGTMGFFKRPDTLEPVKKLLHCIAQTTTRSVVGGGESVAAVKLFGLEQDITFCSSGGGATLHYLIYGSLPGLKAL